MPFIDATKRLQALYAFVDQFAAGDNALRSHFDQVIGDLVSSTNQLAAYLESITLSGSDPRVLGPKAAPPTARNDASPLQAGDFYISTNAAAGRVGLMYRFDGSVFRVVSDFGTVSALGTSLVGAASPAAARGLLELGSAAQQPTTAFAAASVAAEVALALKLADANGVAKTVTDWDTAHLVGPGSAFVQGNAATTNAPEAVNIVAIYAAYDTNNGFLIGVAPTTGKTYLRIRAVGAWGAWLTIPNAAFAATKGHILVGDGSSFVSVGVGADGTKLTADSAEPTGVKWEAGASATVVDANLDTGPATAAGITWVGLRTAGLNTGDVGSYAMLQYTVVAGLAPGATIAGSSLLYSNVDAGASATSPSGTWRLMGRLDASSVRARTSVWLRIS